MDHKHLFYKLNTNKFLLHKKLYERNEVVIFTILVCVHSETVCIGFIDLLNFLDFTVKAEVFIPLCKY